MKQKKQNISDNKINPTIGIIKFVGENHGYIKGVLEESIFIAAKSTIGDLYYSSNLPLEIEQLVRLRKIIHYKDKKLPTVKKLTSIIPVILYPKSLPIVQLFLNNKWYDGVWEATADFPENIAPAFVTIHIKLLTYKKSSINLVLRE